MDDILFTHKLLPLKIIKGKDNTLDIIVKVENKSDKERLMSIEAEIKTDGIIGFDPSFINKKTSVKIGTLQPFSRKEVSIRLFASPNTAEKTYEIALYLIEHYYDYSKVLHVYRRNVSVMVV